MEEKKEEKKEEPESKEEVKETTSTPLIDDARKEADRIEAANKKTEELQAKQEEIIAKQALGGRSDAGSVEQSEKEKRKKEDKERWEDVGMDPFAGEGGKALE